jgi:hypothetical protein
MNLNASCASYEFGVQPLGCQPEQRQGESSALLFSVIPVPFARLPVIGRIVFMVNGKVGAPSRCESAVAWKAPLPGISGKRQFAATKRWFMETTMSETTKTVIRLYYQLQIFPWGPQFSYCGLVGLD